MGRQEDAHEYLRCLLDAMHESCLRPFKPKPPDDLVRTTFINRIFGARLRSRVCVWVLMLSCTVERRVPCNYVNQRRAEGSD